VNDGPVIAPAIDPRFSLSGDTQRRVSVAEGYTRWAASYDQTPNPLLALEERCLLPLLPDVAGKRMLDLACGTGRWLEKFSVSNPVLALGVDLSQAMLGVAREKAAVAGRLARADCLKLPLRDGSFDVAICSFALEHIGTFSELAQECSRVLAENADLYISELHPSAYGAGWRTGFRDQQGALQIDATSHSSSEIVRVFNSLGFELVQSLECFLGEPERPLFTQAGKENYFDKARVIPAIMILHFRRALKQQAVKPERPAVITQASVLENSAPKVLIRPSPRQLSLGLSESWKNIHLLGVFMRRDIKVRYKQTVLGLGWAVLQPLLSVAVFTLVFGRVARVPTGGVPYPLFVFCGLAPWQIFARAIARSNNTLVENQFLLTSAYVPRLILPLAAVLGTFVDFGVEFLLLMAMMLGYHFRISPVALLTTIPFLLLALAVSVGVGLFLSALNVRYRDVGHVVPFFMQLLFFVTPVAYPGSLVPLRLRWLSDLNPMANVAEGFRWALLRVSPPAASGLLYSLLGTLGFLLAALVYFRRVERSFADVV
jgi:lipopolysaccharide transport system permease protein